MCICVCTHACMCICAYVCVSPSELFFFVSKNIKDSYSPVIRESIIEGIEVIQETSSVKKMQSNQELVTLEDPSRAHLDIITDIAIVGSTQQLIASSSQDGVLKLWK